MATLTNSNFEEIRTIILRDATSKSIFKGLGLLRLTWRNLFQAVEDWFVGGFNTRPATSLKAVIDSTLGVTTTVVQARRIALIWIKWRFDKDL